ncbi:unnamed protein product [Chironomus riparius]|uniref:Probable ATP-dependent RNA helicase spindle-E n=1 Tax=Chironomus riparius TaxID=315576 RepID=A0A9N9RL64_9DIPT|nr:unnamed protein product [Chironomus riparius]
MAVNEKKSIYDALNDGAIDDFFNFREIRKVTNSAASSASSKTNKSAPKFKKSEIKTPRNASGTEYVKKYQNIIQQELTESFSGLDLTGLSSVIPLDDSALFDTLSIADELDPPHSEHRNDLPIYRYRDEIIRNVRSNPILMISGPTGCGKSTQVPQYIFDDCKARHQDAKILISQPRKIAAITLAQRVAHERGMTLGTVVGYQVGLNKCIDLTEESTEMTFCTTGVILQKLIKMKSCAQYTHIILDEVHERDLEIDFLLTILRRLNPIKTSTKVILMSATLDIDKFQNFWKIRSLELDDEFLYPPIIDLDGQARKYEIVERYLGDLRKLDVSPDIISREPGISHEMYSFAAQLILLILRLKDSKKRNILVFLPGLPEIERLQEEFRTNENLTNFRKFEPEIHILHSSLSMEEQKLVFINTDNTKIILATNIAESSITIPNVAFVIDFCLTKFLKTHSGSQMSSFVLGWASKNNCKQRAGRTGRVGRGTVFRLVFKDFYDRNLLEHSPPEILMAPLESIVVKIKEFDMGSPLEILASTIDPPDQSAIINAVLAIKEHGGMLIHDDIGNFDYHDGKLTFIGEIMAALPCDIRITKLIVLGYLFSVLDESIIIAAGLNFKAIFINSLTDKMGAYCRKMYWSDGTGSDCLATFNAYNYWFEHHRLKYFKSIEAERAWCIENGLDVKNLNEMRVWIAEVKKRLRYFKFENLPFPNQPRWSSKESILVLKVIMAGAFGVSNFFVTDTTIDMERDAFQILTDLDIFRTVYFRNMDRSNVGEIYKNQLKETFVLKGVCDENSKVNIIFDRVGSERVYVTFEDDHLLNKIDMGFGSGQITPEVYKAVKLCKLQGKVELLVMSSHESMNYALDHGYGECEQSQFQLHYPKIEHPEHWPYPTRSTSKMEGFITHVEHCNKFYFCPRVAYNTRIDLPDRRYESVLEDIKSLLKTAILDPVNIDQKIQPGQIIIYKKAKDILRAELIRYVRDDLVEIYVMDRGTNILVTPKYIYTFQKDIATNKLKTYPPRVFECKLKEIEPSCMQSFGNKWSGEAIEYFKANVLNKDAIIKVFSIVNDVVIVDLKTFDGKNSIYWNTKLVDENYAQECEESYGSKVNHEKRSYAFRILDKPQDPKIEFESVINKNYILRHKQDGPDKSKCDQIIKLVGPYSPLETNLRSISGDITGYVRVDASSINHVLLHDEILGLHSKFYVAADISLGEKNQNVKVRETTAMPNIPGLSVILALVFSPVAQLRRDKEKTRYISIITGLGLDEQYQKPYFHERDALQSLDFNLMEKDISDINRLRFAMSSMLYRDPFHELPNLNDRQREQLLKNIKESFLTIINKNHTVRDIQMGNDRFKWNVDQEDAIRIASRIGHGAIWDYISIPPLNEMPYIMKEKLIKHAQDLEDDTAMYSRECKLCGKPFNNPNEQKLHLISKMHKIRKQQLGI